MYISPCLSITYDIFPMEPRPISSNIRSDAYKPLDTNDLEPRTFDPEQTSPDWGDKIVVTGWKPTTYDTDQTRSDRTKNRRPRSQVYARGYTRRGNRSGETQTVVTGWYRTTYDQDGRNQTPRLPSQGLRTWVHTRVTPTRFYRARKPDRQSDIHKYGPTRDVRVHATFRSKMRR